MHTAVKIRYPIFQPVFIFPPRLTIHSGCGLFLQTTITFPQQVHRDMVQQRREPFLFPFSCNSSHTSKSRRHAVFLALSRGHGVLHGVLLGPPPSLRALLLYFHTLVRTLHRYYAAVRLLTSVHARLRLSPSRSGLLSFAG